jgi:hypothetical protein
MRSPLVHLHMYIGCIDIDTRVSFANRQTLESFFRWSANLGSRMESGCSGRDEMLCGSASGRGQGSLCNSHQILNARGDIVRNIAGGHGTTLHVTLHLEDDSMARAKQKTRAASRRGPVGRKARSGRAASASARQTARTARGRSAKKTSRANDRQDRWSAQEDRQLKSMVKQGVPIREVVSELGRTESAVRQHVYKLGLALRGRKRR